MGHYRVQPYRDEAGEFRSRVIADNGDIVFVASESYHNLKDCTDIAHAVFPTVSFDWALVPDPDALIDDGDDDDTNDD